MTLQIIPVTYAADELPVYKKTDAFSACKGEQGYDGWYYMYETSNGEYKEMSWGGSSFTGNGGAQINEHFIVPGYGTPAILAWEAPYSGTVTLTEQDNTVYRNGPNPSGGDVIATLLKNDEILTDDNAHETKWTFDNTCSNGNPPVGRQSYKVTEMHITKGDVLYHKVDCGTNNTGSAIYWKPIITYTAVDSEQPEESPKPTDTPSPTATPTPSTPSPSPTATPTPAPSEEPKKTEYKKTDAFSACKGEQGYDGWYYMYETSSGEYKEMSWGGSSFTGNGGAQINEHFIVPGYGTPAILAWEAPYSGTVTLTELHNVYRDGPNAGGGDVTATLMLNDKVLTDTNGNKTQWVYDNTCYNGKGNQQYKVTELRITKGDILYHKTDCGTNNTGSAIYWKPIITYTQIDAVQPTPTPKPTATPTPSTPTPKPTPTPTPSEKPEEKKSVYKKVDAFSECNGQQGYDGWYYYSKNSSTQALTELPWNGNSFAKGGNAINTHFIQPGYNTPTVLAWKAPYSGIVTLSLTSNTMYRSAANPKGGDTVATLRLNDTIVKQNNGNDARWVFDNTCKNGVGNQNYTITGVQIKKGDVLYHEVDCGENNTSADVFWKPIITYTYFEPYRLEGDGSEENPYLIDSAEGLNAVAEAVKTADGAVYSKFTEDVKASRNTTLIEKYTGVINGNNHVLTLYGKPLIEKAAGEVRINNLIIDGQVSGKENIAAFIGCTDEENEDSVIIANCGNAATVSASDDNAAGFVGWVSDNYTITVKNSFNYGAVTSAGSGADPFANVSIFGECDYQKCYYLKDGTKANGSSAVNPSVSIARTADEFAGGAVTYELGNVFGQKLTDPKDKYPVFKTSDNGVYRKGNVYTNTLIDPSELKFSMQSSFSSDGKQGVDGWYYLKFDSKKQEYAEMPWQNNCYGMKDGSGNLMSFVTKQGIMQPTLDVCVGWKAPMAGKVRLTTGTKIFKASKGADVTVEIITRGQTCWSAEIPGGQTKPEDGAAHDIVVDVGCGDMIYFAVSAKSSTSAAILWTPQVEYVQTVKFTAADKQITDMSQLKDGDRIECMFYDDGSLEKKSNAYLAIYDENGTMMKISEPASVGGASTGSGAMLSFDADFAAEDYKNWELRLMIVNGDGKNINPIIKHDLYGVK